jgi:hypothetical protein
MTNRGGGDMAATTVISTVSATIPVTGSLVATGVALASTQQVQLWQTSLGILRDLVVTFAAAVGAYVAIRGLNAWRSQLRGQSEYTLAKRILTLLQQYRDAIRATRHPWMEYGLADDIDGEGLTFEQRKYLGLQNAYEERWERVQQARAELYSELLEARVLWGSTIDDALAPLLKLQTELLLAIRDHLKLSNPDVSKLDKEHLETPDQRKRLNRLLYDKLSDEDEFASQTDQVIEAVSAVLSPHLGKKR